MTPRHRHGEHSKYTFTDSDRGKEMEDGQAGGRARVRGQRPSWGKVTRGRRPSC